MLSEAFNPDRNSLNAIRLVLAATVIVSHSWPLGGFGPDPRWGDQNLGEWAVAGFFAISGYLILASRLRSASIWKYFWLRFLRIYPAFIVCLVVVAFVVAPLSALIDGKNGYDPGSAFAFVYKNAALLINQFGIDGTLTTTPYSGAWVGPMWTLFYEFLCYIWVGLLVTIAPRKWLGPILIGVLVICAAACIYATIAHWDISSRPVRVLRLSGYFAAGALLFAYRKRVPVSAQLAIIAVLLVAVTMAFGVFRIAAGLPLAYVMMYLGARLPLSRVGEHNDVSYGLYIWAFPVQQILALTILRLNLPLVVYIAASIAVTIPLAWASWLLVEKPTKKLRYRRAPRPVASAGPPPQVEEKASQRA
jgi:peptidoglycan/LPS O-acetylase OafA/YrhL